MKTAILLAAAAMLPGTLLAQQPKVVTAAPIPAQIVNAKRVFISNSGGFDGVEGVNSHDRNMLYDEFYSAMKDWGKYELMSSPAEADLVLALRMTHPIDVFKGDSHEVPALELEIVDPRTRITLWAFSEGPVRTSKSLKKSVASLIDDIKNLLARSAAGSPGRMGN